MVIEKDVVDLLEKYREETKELLFYLENETFNQIVSLGKEVVTILFRYITVYSWEIMFILRTILKDGPKHPMEHLGMLSLLKKDWIDWGRTKGYL